IVGSVSVAWFGFYTTRDTSRQTMRVSVAEAHRNRIWERKAPAYEAALAELASRQVRRERAVRLPGDKMTAAERLETYFKTRETPEWSKAEGQLMAYATQKVWDALQAARSADLQAEGLFDIHLAGPMHEASRLQAAGDNSAVQRILDEQLGPA